MTPRIRARKSAEVVNADREEWPKPEDAWYHSLRSSRQKDAEERKRMQQQQQEALRISRVIDEGLQESKKALEKKSKAVRVLLLGQAESGKSTVLRNFQLAFCPEYFGRERDIWKTIIQLNLIGSVKMLLALLDEEMDGSTSNVSPHSYLTAVDSLPSPPRSRKIVLTDSHRRLRLKLLPLLSVKTTLAQRLFPEPHDPSRIPELCVRAGSPWKGIIKKVVSFERRKPVVLQAASEGEGKNAELVVNNIAAKITNDPSVWDSDSSSQQQRGNEGPRRSGTGDSRFHKDDPTMILAASREDIIALWQDSTVKEILKVHGIRLEEGSGFFLDDAYRIANTDYVPAEGDILRARLRTIGVEEHICVMENGHDAGSSWYIYDVGGTRSMRRFWIPYFDDVHAIFFLAPLSFHQVLEEDSKVNRLEDSTLLWKEICASPLLAKATIILFFNKMDLLKKVLASGIQVKHYVPSYGDGPNDVHHVTQYFKDKFHGFHKKLSPIPRSFICHETSAIDPNTTSAILCEVREGIFRNHLREMAVI